MTHPNRPLEWYIDKLQRGEPFTSLLYGDGEFTAMSGEVTGRAYTNYREVVTQQLVEELRASLTEPGDDIIRGTDLFLAYPETYHGNDQESVKAVNRRMRALMTDEQIAKLVDGTVWDVAVREGKLGPLLKVIREQFKRTVLAANANLLRKTHHWFRVVMDVPERNACSELDDLEYAFANRLAWEPQVIVLCMGLGAIPLAMRLRKRFPEAAILDLGSTFDVFARIGAERGWRRELYEDEAKWRACVEANLEGL